MSKAIWKAVPNPETKGARWWIVEERDGSQHSIGTAGVEDDARVMAAAPDLLAAAEMVLTDLEARIDEAPVSAKPVFRGIADLHSAIAKARGEDHS